MPTVFRVDGYRFYFYSHEPNEPAHVHVDKAGASAKFWLEKVALAGNIGFSAHELSEVFRLVAARRSELLEAWNGYFGLSG